MGEFLDEVVKVVEGFPGESVLEFPFLEGFFFLEEVKHEGFEIRLVLDGDEGVGGLAVKPELAFTHIFIINQISISIVNSYFSK